MISTYKEPVAGWTDNLYGPSGICSGAVRGFVHAIYGNGRKKANLVPADWVVNAMISCAWDIHRRYNTKFLKTFQLLIHIMHSLIWNKFQQLIQSNFIIICRINSILTIIAHVTYSD